MEFDLFETSNGSKTQVLRFADVASAKKHAVDLFGEFLFEEEDGDCIDAFTTNGFIVAIEPVKASALVN